MADGIYSDLALGAYFIMALALETRPESLKGGGEGQLSLDYDIASKEDSETDVKVEIHVRVNASDEEFEANGFRMSVSVAGFFEAADLKEAHAEDWRLLMLTNSLSVLYGVARAALNSVAAQSPIGQFVLPCVDMREFLRLRQENAKRIDAHEVSAD